MLLTNNTDKDIVFSGAIIGRIEDAPPVDGQVSPQVAAIGELAHERLIDDTQRPPGGRGFVPMSFHVSATETREQRRARLVAERAEYDRGALQVGDWVAFKAARYCVARVEELHESGAARVSGDRWWPRQACRRITDEDARRVLVAAERVALREGDSDRQDEIDELLYDLDAVDEDDDARPDSIESDEDDGERTRESWARYMAAAMHRRDANAAALEADEALRLERDRFGDL